jgi:hypothetical protein
MPRRVHTSLLAGLLASLLWSGPVSAQDAGRLCDATMEHTDALAPNDGRGGNAEAVYMIRCNPDTGEFQILTNVYVNDPLYAVAIDSAMGWLAENGVDTSNASIVPMPYCPPVPNGLVGYDTIDDCTALHAQDGTVSPRSTPAAGAPGTTVAARTAGPAEPAVPSGAINWPQVLADAPIYRHTEATLLPIGGWKKPLLLPNSISQPPFSNLKQIAAGRWGDGTDPSSSTYYVVEIASPDDMWTRAVLVGQAGKAIPDFRSIGKWVCDGQPTSSPFHYCRDVDVGSGESFLTLDDRAILVYHLFSEGNWSWSAYWYRPVEDMTFSVDLTSAAGDWFGKPELARDEATAQSMVSTVSSLESVTLP